MANPDAATSEPSAPDIRRRAELAFVEMARRHIPPSPANYAIWFAYVSASDAELQAEIAAHDATQRPYSVEYTQHLAERFQHVLPGTETPAETTLQSAEKMMQHLAETVRSYSGNTARQQQALDSGVSALSSASDPAAVAKVAGQVLSQLGSIREENQRFEERLKASQSEVLELKAELHKTATEAQRDFLTGVYNRKGLEERLGRMLVEARDSPAGLTLMMLDIDHFKPFNDTYGHQLGDQVLKLVGSALVQSVRGKDLVARYGGEEFTVVLPDTPLNGGGHVAEAIRKTLAGQVLRRKDTGETIRPVTLSIGVAQFKPRSDSAETLIKRADDALYRAKKAGRNRVKKEDED